MKSSLLTLFLISMFAFSCLAQPNNQPRMQDGPWNHQIHFAVSKDGITWNIQESPLMKEASVPDIIVLSGRGKIAGEGTICVYTVDARPMKASRFENISRLISKDDGKSWSEPEIVKIEGMTETNFAPVDPSIVQLEDGKLRLYFYAMKKAAPGVNSTNKFYSAISEDGINFTVENGVRFEAAEVTDPEVIFANGEWLMFISHREESWLARSKDGLNFKRDEKTIFSGGGVPGAMALADGRVRVFLCGRGGIKSVIFNPKTNEIFEESGIRANRAADPAIYRQADGNYVAIVKTWTNVPNPPSNNNRGIQPKFMQLFDTNKDGRLSQTELVKMQESFEKLDENKDGFLDMRELMGPPPTTNRNEPVKPNQ